MFNPLKTLTQSETYDFVSRFINMKKHLDLARLADGFLCHSGKYTVHSVNIKMSSALCTVLNGIGCVYFLYLFI